MWKKRRMPEHWKRDPVLPVYKRVKKHCKNDRGLTLLRHHLEMFERNSQQEINHRGGWQLLWIPKIVSNYFLK
jgi:hypothetical protein